MAKIQVKKNGKNIQRLSLVDPDGRDAGPLIRRGDAPGARWKKQDLNKMAVGNVLGIPLKLVPKFREPFEEKAGGELKSMRCYHTEDGVYVRFMILPKGPACLDCMVASINEVYPR